MEYIQPATSHTISEENCLHAEVRYEFMLYSNADKALCNQLQATVSKVYINAIIEPIIGIDNTTCHQLLTHLHTTYGRITEAELDKILGQKPGTHEKSIEPAKLH
jgi:hypothetical protein